MRNFVSSEKSVNLSLAFCFQRSSVSLLRLNNPDFSFTDKNYAEFFQNFYNNFAFKLSAIGCLFLLRLSILYICFYKVLRNRRVFFNAFKRRLHGIVEISCMSYRSLLSAFKRLLHAIPGSLCEPPNDCGATKSYLGRLPNDCGAMKRYLGRPPNDCGAMKRYLGRLPNDCERRKKTTE